MKHNLRGDFTTKKVYLDDVELDQNVVKNFKCQTEDFDWGILNSGSGKLALAILLTLTGDYDGYQKLKHELIASLPNGHNFEITFDLDYGKARQAAIQDAMAVNKYLTRQFLITKSNRELLAFCHPTYRDKYANEMGLKVY
jgi:hypothetical protein